jgi:hypothetical protein
MVVHAAIPICTASHSATSALHIWRVSLLEWQSKPAPLGSVSMFAAAVFVVTPSAGSTDSNLEIPTPRETVYKCLRLALAFETNLENTNVLEAFFGKWQICRSASLARDLTAVDRTLDPIAPRGSSHMPSECGPPSRCKPLVICFGGTSRQSFGLPMPYACILLSDNFPPSSDASPSPREKVSSPVSSSSTEGAGIHTRLCESFAYMWACSHSSSLTNKSILRKTLKFEICARRRFSAAAGTCLVSFPRAL